MILNRYITEAKRWRHTISMAPNSGNPFAIHRRAAFMLRALVKNTILIRRKEQKCISLSWYDVEITLTLYLLLVVCGR